MLCILCLVWVMSADELHDLINSLDLHTRYNLRRTAARRARLADFLSTPHNPNTNMSDPTNSNTPPSTPTQTPTQQQLYMIAQSTRSLPVARFTGYVPEGVPNRIQLMSYDVNRWLCDAETRCHVKGITDDVLKIKEAKLAVSAEFGDAAVVLNTGRMNELTVYSEFKSKCLKFWRCASERDRYHALSDFLSVNYNKSMGIFAGDLERARSRVLQDLQGDSKFQMGNAASWAGSSRSSEILVSLEEVVNYFSWGVLFKSAPPSFRDALRKVDINYTDDYLDILSSVQSEMLKSDKSMTFEMSAFASTKSKKQIANGSETGDRKQYSSGNSYNNSRKVVCFRCEKQGHISKNCNVSLKCTFCNKTGHTFSRCFAAKKQNKKPFKKTENVKSTNVVDAVNEPSGENGS